MGRGVFFWVFNTRYREFGIWVRCQVCIVQTICWIRSPITVYNRFRSGATCHFLPARLPYIHVRSLFLVLLFGILFYELVQRFGTGLRPSWTETRGSSCDDDLGSGKYHTFEDAFLLEERTTYRTLFEKCEAFYTFCGKFILYNYSISLWFNFFSK